MRVYKRNQENEEWIREEEEENSQGYAFLSLSFFFYPFIPHSFFFGEFLLKIVSVQMNIGYRKKKNSFWMFTLLLGRYVYVLCVCMYLTKYNDILNWNWNKRQPQMWYTYRNVHVMFVYVFVFERPIGNVHVHTSIC